jgi:hypothetical protein
MQEITEKEDSDEVIVELDKFLTKQTAGRVLAVLHSQAKILMNAYFKKIIQNIEFNRDASLNIYYWKQKSPPFLTSSLLSFILTPKGIEVRHDPPLIRPTDTLENLSGVPMHIISSEIFTLDPNSLDLEDILSKAIQAHLLHRLILILQSTLSSLKSDHLDTIPFANITDSLYLDCGIDKAIRISIDYMTGNPAVYIIGKKSPDFTERLSTTLDALAKDWASIQSLMKNKMISNCAKLIGVNWTSQPLRFNKALYSRIREGGMSMIEPGVSFIELDTMVPTEGSDYYHSFLIRLEGGDKIQCSIVHYCNEAEERRLSLGSIYPGENLYNQLKNVVKRGKKMLPMFKIPILCLANPVFTS